MRKSVHLPKRASVADCSSLHFHTHELRLDVELSDAPATEHSSSSSTFSSRKPAPALPSAPPRAHLHTIACVAHLRAAFEDHSVQHVMLANGAGYCFGFNAPHLQSFYWKQHRDDDEHQLVLDALEHDARATLFP